VGWGQVSERRKGQELIAVFVVILCFVPWAIGFALSMRTNQYIGLPVARPRPLLPLEEDDLQV
jgi:hypothetical protein